MVELFHHIKEEVTRFYGDLDEPFRCPADEIYKSFVPSPLLREIMQLYYVKDETATAIDVALHLRLRYEGTESILLLSSVGQYAMVLRQIDDNLGYQAIDKTTYDVLEQEWLLLGILDKYGYLPVTRELALTPLRINLWETEADETTVYHALFSDRGTVPPI